MLLVHNVQVLLARQKLEEAQAGGGSATANTSAKRKRTGDSDNSSSKFAKKSTDAQPRSTTRSATAAGKVPGMCVLTMLLPFCALHWKVSYVYVIARS
jgi:hypothetical protein